MDHESAAPLVLEAARALAREYPGKSVFLSCYASLFHTPEAVPDSVIWTGTAGHANILDGRTLAELIAKIRAVDSPQSKLKKARELRIEADQLERDATIQQDSIPGYSYSVGQERDRIMRLADEQDANAKLASIPPQEQPHA